MAGLGISDINTWFSAPILHSRVLLHLNINTWLYKIYVHNHIHIFFVGNRGCCEGYSASLHISRPPKHLKPGVAGRSRAHRIGQQRLQNNTPWKINGWNLNLIVWKMIFRISNWVIFRFHVNLPGCTGSNNNNSNNKNNHNHYDYN